MRTGSSLEAELGAAPVATLGVVADGVVGAHANPVRDGAVLLHLLAQLLLDAERLLGRHGDERRGSLTTQRKRAAGATTHSKGRLLPTLLLFHSPAPIIPAWYHGPCPPLVRVFKTDIFVHFYLTPLGPDDQKWPTVSAFGGFG